ncbi:MAG TPA: alginate lyase family protein [Bacteroidota bacterium]|nr:alginate lyase family protein [Bacteroidota bacterium]
MDVRWYLRRLSLMSPPEIAYRCAFSVGLAIRKAAFHLQARPPHPVHAEPNPVALFPHLADKAHILDVARRVYSWSPASADRILAHEFSFFALQQRNFGPSIPWNTDILNGVTAPLQYGPAMDYRDTSLCGDIKYLWEPNRFLHLPELAKGFYMTGDHRYADEVFRQIDSWIEACPCPRGPNWSSALEVAIRLINWCVTHEILAQTEVDPFVRYPDSYKKWMGSIGDHLRFLKRHRSRYSSANNHLIGELTGLFIGSACFSLPGSRGDLSGIRDLLETEALRQHWPDGINKEQAVRYQAFVFEFLLLAGITGARIGYPFSNAYWDVLRRSAEYIRSLSELMGYVPALGDDDEGKVVSLDGSLDIYRTMLAEAARAFGQESLGCVRADSSEEGFWLVGDGPPVHSVGAFDDEPRLAFPEGGMFFLRGGGATLAFDCGPLGYLSLAAHGHADALSILLSYKGMPILVDAGTYAYHTHPEWRRYFRGTFAHNTVRLDGQDQSLMGGNFMWLQKARAQLHKNEGDTLKGSHDGYARFSDPVIHTREVNFDSNSGTFIIKDFLAGQGNHTVDLAFTFSPDCRCSCDGNVVRCQNGPAAVTLYGDAAVGAPKLLQGSTAPPGGWFSAGLDRKAATTTAWWTWSMQGTMNVITRIHLEP